MSREDGRQRAGKTAIKDGSVRQMGEGTLVPLIQGAAACEAPPRPGSGPGRGVRLTDPLGGGCSVAARPRPAQTATPLPPRPRLSALPPHSARRRPLPDTQLPPTPSRRIFSN